MEEKPSLSEEDEIEALELIAECKGYSRQEDGFKPVLIFVSDRQYADIKKYHIDMTRQVQTWLDNDIEVYRTMEEEKAMG